MKKYFYLLIVILTAITLCIPVCADEFEFHQLEMSFKNFLRCELTRTDGPDYFNGQPFTITMIDLFAVHEESDMKIVTGAVKCFVKNRYITLYAAVGVENILGKDKVSYFVIRHKDFTILATELFKYPYKDRCEWGPYRIDTAN